MQSRFNKFEVLELKKDKKEKDKKEKDKKEKEKENEIIKSQKKQKPLKKNKIKWQQT